MKPLRLIVICSLALVLGMSAARAQETVRTRAATHPDYGRIVFDWPYRVGFEADIADQVLTVRFDSALSTDLDRVVGLVGDYVRAGTLSDDGREVRFELTGAFGLTAFRNGNSVVLDLAGQSEAPVQAVRVRIGEHSAFTRFVFDWDAPVPFETRTDEGRIEVRFERKARFDIGAIARRLPEHLSGVAADQDGDATIFRVNSTRRHRLRTFTSGSKVVVDFVDLGADAEAPAAAPQQATPPPENAPRRLVTPEAPEPATDAPAPAAPAPAEPEKTAEPPAAPQPAEVATLPARSEEPALAASDRAAAPEETPKATPRAAPTDTETQAPEPATPAPGPEEAVSPAPAQAATAPQPQVPLQEDVEPVFLTFPWPQDVGAAVFRRAGYIWLVFDQVAPQDLERLRLEGRPLVSQIHQLPSENATVIRLRTDDDINPTVRREGFEWVAEFRRQPIQPRMQVAIRAEIDTETGPRLAFPADEPGSVAMVADPDVGDVLTVATLRSSGHGVRAQRVYPEFNILASSQGVAIESFSDNIEFVRTFNGFALSSPNGLHISALSPDAPVAKGPVLSTRRLFAPAAWMNGEGNASFVPSQQALLRTVIEVPIEKRNAARLDLARFYFARGRGQEALGVLSVVQRDDDKIINKPEFRALVGAASMLSGRLDQAMEYLADPRLDGFQEAALWRGATYAERGDWTKAAEQFSSADSLLRRYPNPLKSRLGLLRAEASIATGDIRSAGIWLNEVSNEFSRLGRSRRGDLLYHLGRVALARRDIDRATELWGELAASRDLRNAARAEYALVNLGLQQESLELKDAIERLEALRFRWRGDVFEMNVLKRLGELYLQALDYYNGLTMMRLAVTHFPDEPGAQALAEEMTSIFRALYVDGEADRLPPLRSLALYDEFRELTPAGTDGDYMIEKLADRLIDVDLLDRAADLLDHQLRFRLQGEEKARVGAKAAIVRLLDRDAPAALDTLSRTNFPNLPKQLEGDRRRIQAKIMFELGRNDEAITLLAGDISRDADMLRRDIHWREENWSEAAKVLQRLAGPPLKEGEIYAESRARYVLNWAVALRLNQDEPGLAHLRDVYGPAMALSPLAESFQFIASPSQAKGDLESTLKELAREDHFEAFLTNYRERLVRERTNRDENDGILSVPPAPPFVQQDVRVEETRAETDAPRAG